MATTRVSMRTIREVLRLCWGMQMSQAKAAAACGLARSTVADYLNRARVAGLGWPLAADLDDSRLESLLFPPAPPSSERALKAPDWPVIHRELQKKGVTLQLLWQEYRSGQPNGYQYSQFSHLYSQWKKTTDVIFRSRHQAGEKLFIDFAGQTVPIHDPMTGVTSQAQVFVAVWGASNYTYAEALWSQKSQDFIGAHIRAFKFFCCVPHVLVPDNLKSAVVRADRHEPDINLAYHAMAAHYGVAVVPTRPRKPRDKAKVEAGVLLVERWILAAIRKQTFFSLTELNEAIMELLEKLNIKPFKKMPGSRKSHFEEIDRPAANPLPARPYEIRAIKLARVHIDYHVDLEKHYYSVPYHFVQKSVEIHYSDTIVEIFQGGRRIASHPRLHKAGGYSTLPEHMPESHRQYARWTPERLASWAKAEAGPATALLAEQIMLSKRFPEEGFKAVLGLINLGNRYGTDRLEKACSLANQLHAYSYRTVKDILSSCRDQQAERVQAPDPALDHENVRGPGYYH